MFKQLFYNNVNVLYCREVSLTFLLVVTILNSCHFDKKPVLNSNGHISRTSLFTYRFCLCQNNDDVVNILS